MYLRFKAMPDLPQWQWYITEVSTCVYKVIVRHEAGPQAEFVGTDYDALLEQARQWAEAADEAIQKKPHRPRGVRE